MTTFLFSAGEASGDLLASELVGALKASGSGAGSVGGDKGLVFIGAGGAKMAEAGVRLAFDMTQHAVIGLWDVLANLGKFRRLMRQLVELALERKPDVIVCVDFSGFNRRFAAAVRARQHEVPGWKPRIVQFVSPQVWASRPGRAKAMAKDFDLLLSIFPFEKAWYARQAPELRVEFVGHPMLDRYGGCRPFGAAGDAAGQGTVPGAAREVLLLPGSRRGELRKHLPVMIAAAGRIRTGAEGPVRFRLVVPNDSLLPLARDLSVGLPELQIQVGDLAGALRAATLAIASTGTVTMECAFFGVPAVTLYRTNLLTYEIGRRIVTVKSLTMPNLLAGETVYPEFIQHDATPERLAEAALGLLNAPDRREAMRRRLSEIIGTLGESGACRRAAAHIWSLLPAPQLQ